MICHLKKGLQHLLHYDLVPILSVLLVCFFPCFFIWANNAEEAGPETMLTFLFIFSVNAAALLAICCICYRNVARAAFYTDISMLVIANFSLALRGLQKVLPGIPALPCLLLALVLMLALFFLLLIKKPDLRIPCTLVLIAFGTITLMNGAINAKAIYTTLTHHPWAEQQPDDTGILFDDESERPNVYYLLYDEYAGYENLMHYYGYDNDPFLTALEERGFSVARQSHNTETCYTHVCIPNLLNLDYVMDPTWRFYYHYYFIDNSVMVRMFRQNGYTINMADHLNYIGTTNVDHILTDHQYKQNISEYLFRNTIYTQSERITDFLNRSFHIDVNMNYYNSVMNVLAAEKSCWKYTTDGPTLTIGYLASPHSPLNIGRNGELLDYAVAYAWDDPQYYLNYLAYTSDQILETVDSILEHDPEALVILQSDHGARYPIHQIQVGLLDWYDPEVEDTYMTNILNCVYYQGRSYDIEGETGINTLRMVFSDVLGADLAPIEPIVSHINYSSRVKPTE